MEVEKKNRKQIDWGCFPDCLFTCLKWFWVLFSIIASPGHWKIIEWQIMRVINQNWWACLFDLLAGFLLTCFLFFFILLREIYLFNQEAASRNWNNKVFFSVTVVLVLGSYVEELFSFETNRYLISCSGSILKIIWEGFMELWLNSS